MLEAPTKPVLDVEVRTMDITDTVLQSFMSQDFSCGDSYGEVKEDTAFHINTQMLPNRKQK